MPLYFSFQAENNPAEKEHVSLLSSSDHSDIMTLGDMKDDDHAEVDASVHEEFYLGTSCSSQYAFTANETGTTAAPQFVSGNSVLGLSRLLHIAVTTIIFA